jgi:hypothetical protein
MGVARGVRRTHIKRTAYNPSLVARGVFDDGF